MTRDEMIIQLEQEEKVVREKVEKLRKPVIQAEEDLQHIVGMLAYYRRASTLKAEIAEFVSELTNTFPHIKLRGMTHSAAVVAIAKHNGGIVRAQDAKRLMIKAGIMSQTKNSTNMTHNAIIRTDLFERIAPGEYRLKETAAKSPTQVFDPARDAFADLKPVQ